MELVKVDSVPERRNRSGQFAKLVREFMESDMEVARVDFNNREETKAALTCLTYHAKRKPFNVHMRGYSIYLEKR